jgi:hypothetical protein
MRYAIACAIAACASGPLAASRADAQEPPATRIVLPSVADDITANAVESADEPQEQPARPVAVEYSDGYATRAKIHKYASFATLPLFAAEIALGQSLYDGTGSDSKRSAHAVVGAAITGLFAVESVTGIWNMWEARKDPAGRTRRIAHGILMLAADAGFVATSATAPSHGRNGLVTIPAGESTHRAIALTSIGIATAGYLMMFFGER